MALPASVLSFLIGLFSSVSFLMVLIRALMVGGAAALFACCSYFLMKRYLPELLSIESRGNESHTLDAQTDDDEIKILRETFISPESQSSDDVALDIAKDIDDVDSVQDSGDSISMTRSSNPPMGDEEIENIKSESPEVLAQAIRTVLMSDKDDAS